MNQSIILVGGGGHCKACIDVIEQENKFKIAGIVDVAEKVGQTLLGYPIIASDDEIPELVKTYSNYLVTLGQIKSPKIRKKLYHLIKQSGGHLPVIQSPYSYVSKHSQIGEGTIIMHRTTINADARVGANCILNNHSLIEHDSKVGEHCHISTSAVVNGGTEVGAGTFIGSGTVLREYIHIGSDSVIGAGHTILKSVPEGSFIKSRKID